MDEIVKNALFGLEPTPPIPEGLKEPSEEPQKRNWEDNILLWVIVIILIILVVMKMLGWI